MITIDKTYLESHKIVKHILSHTENEGRLNAMSDHFLMIKFHVVQCIRSVQLLFLPLLNCTTYYNTQRQGKIQIKNKKIKQIKPLSHTGTICTDMISLGDKR